MICRNSPLNYGLRNEKKKRRKSGKAKKLPLMNTLEKQFSSAANAVDFEDDDDMQSRREKARPRSAPAFMTHSSDDDDQPLGLLFA
jgi:hypothetical protein